MPLDVAVQVVNYRTRRHLRRACRPCSPTSPAAASTHRVLVLDNASGDDLSELAAAHPEVEFETAERNLGFGAGHNLLAARHDAAALLFLNPDTRFIEPRTVARLLAALRRRRRGGRPAARVAPSGEVDPRDHGELHGFRARVAQAAGDSHYRRRDEPADVAWVSGAACLVARARVRRGRRLRPGLLPLQGGGGPVPAHPPARAAACCYLPTVRVRHDGGVVASRDEHLPASVARFATSTSAPAGSGG